MRFISKTESTVTFTQMHLARQGLEIRTPAAHQPTPAHAISSIGIPVVAVDVVRREIRALCDVKRRCAQRSRNDVGSEGPAMWQKSTKLGICTLQLTKSASEESVAGKTGESGGAATRVLSATGVVGEPPIRPKMKYVASAIRLPLRGHVNTPAHRAQGRVELPAQVGVPRGVAPCRTARARGGRRARSASLGERQLRHLAHEGLSALPPGGQAFVLGRACRRLA